MVLSSRPLNLGGWRLLLHAGVQEVPLPAYIPPCVPLHNHSSLVHFSSLRKLTFSDRPTERLVALSFQRRDKSSRHLQRSRRPFSRAPEKFLQNPRNFPSKQIANKIRSIARGARIYTELITRDRTRYIACLEARRCTHCANCA